MSFSDRSETQGGSASIPDEWLPFDEYGILLHSKKEEGRLFRYPRSYKLCRTKPNDSEEYIYLVIKNSERLVAPTDPKDVFVIGSDDWAGSCSGFAVVLKQGQHLSSAQPGGNGSGGSIPSEWQPDLSSRPTPIGLHMALWQAQVARADMEGPKVLGRIAEQLGREFEHAGYTECDTPSSKYRMSETERYCMYQKLEALLEAELTSGRLIMEDREVSVDVWSP